MFSEKNHKAFECVRNVRRQGMFSFSPQEKYQGSFMYKEPLEKSTVEVENQKQYRLC